jgi:hypothetical protein
MVIYSLTNKTEYKNMFLSMIGQKKKKKKKRKCVTMSNLNPLRVILFLSVCTAVPLIVLLSNSQNWSLKLAFITF